MRGAHRVASVLLSIFSYVRSMKRRKPCGVIRGTLDLSDGCRVGEGCESIPLCLIGSEDGCGVAVPATGADNKTSHPD